MRVCTVCQSPLKTGQVFCRICGTRVVVVEVEPEVKKVKVKSKQRSRRFKIFAALIVIVLIFTAPQIADGYTVFIKSGQSEEIDDIANNSGFDLHGRAIFYNSNPQLVDADTLNDNCPHDESVLEYGCYKPASNQMFLLRVTDSELKDIQYASAAHETLHAAWTKMSASERGEVAALVKTLYDDTENNASKQLHQLLEPYPDDEATQLNEAHSFIGAQVESTYFSPGLLSYYEKYFENRAIPVYAYSSFDTKLDKRKTDLTSESDALVAQLAELKAYRVKAVDPGQYYINNSCYYGPNSACNQNITSLRNNTNRFNTLVDQYEKARVLFNSHVDQYNAMLHIFYPSRPAVPQDNNTI